MSKKSISLAASSRVIGKVMGVLLLVLVDAFLRRISIVQT
jgi:hypothetical protein